MTKKLFEGQNNKVATSRAFLRLFPENEEGYTEKKKNLPFFKRLHDLVPI